MDWKHGLVSDVAAFPSSSPIPCTVHCMSLTLVDGARRTDARHMIEKARCRAGC